MEFSYFNVRILNLGIFYNFTENMNFTKIHRISYVYDFHDSGPPGEPPGGARRGAVLSPEGGGGRNPEMAENI